MVNIYCSIKVYIFILTYLLNIDSNVAIFRQYRIEVEKNGIEASLIGTDTIGETMQIESK